jgi:hypothetical protein
MSLIAVDAEGFFFDVQALAVLELGFSMALNPYCSGH